MSHYMRVKTQLQEPRFILAALDAMNLAYEVSSTETGMLLRGWLDNARADIVVRQATLRAQGYTAHADLGFRQTEEGYEVLMDDYDLNRYGGREKLVNPLVQQYGVAFALDWAEEQGFTAEVVPQANGDIQVVTTQW
ncbi:MAG: DUF1257 domain-containing protein [Anaerolineae bacterium]|nr:DUF1257 domain-containing protein [Anaerolineae bacterium]